MGWHPASTSRLVVSLLLPGSLEAEDWLMLARQKRPVWPMQMTSHAMANTLPTEQYMRRERRRLQARHIWEELEPQWTKLRERLHTRYVTNLDWKILRERLFLNRYGNQQRFWENEYRGYDREEVKAQWDRTRDWFQRSATARFPFQLVISPLLLQFDSKDATSWEWIAQQEHNIAQVWHTKQGVYVLWTQSAGRRA